MTPRSLSLSCASALAICALLWQAWALPGEKTPRFDMPASQMLFVDFRNEIGLDLAGLEPKDLIVEASRGEISWYNGRCYLTDLQAGAAVSLKLLTKADKKLCDSRSMQVAGSPAIDIRDPFPGLSEVEREKLASMDPFVVTYPKQMSKRVRYFVRSYTVETRTPDQERSTMTCEQEDLPVALVDAILQAESGTQYHFDKFEIGIYEVDEVDTMFAEVKRDFTFKVK